jgi:hypothetical protein
MFEKSFLAFPHSDPKGRGEQGRQHQHNREQPAKAAAVFLQAL